MDSFDRVLGTTAPITARCGPFRLAGILFSECAVDEAATRARFRVILRALRALRVAHHMADLIADDEEALHHNPPRCLHVADVRSPWNALGNETVQIGCPALGRGFPCMIKVFDDECTARARDMVAPPGVYSPQA